MNKGIAEFFAANGMTVNGNDAYGIVRGYETNGILHVMENVSPFKLHISFYATDEQKRAMENAFRNAAIKYFRFSFTPYGLLIGLNDITVKRLVNRLPSLFDLIYGIISENGGLGWGYCPVCGDSMENAEDKKHIIDGLVITLDDACVSNINAVIDAENQDFSEAPNNYIPGFCGAVLGGIVGGLLAVVLYYLGFVSALSAVVAVLLGAFLYQKFQGKPNKIMVVIVSFTSLVCMVASILIIYIVAAGAAAAEAGVAMTALEAFSYLMEDAEFAGYFFRDLAMVVIFSAIGIGVEIFNLAKKVQRKQSIR